MPECATGLIIDFGESVVKYNKYLYLYLYSEMAFIHAIQTRKTTSKNTIVMMINFQLIILFHYSLFKIMIYLILLF